jgi:hypothetical protein
MPCDNDQGIMRGIVVVVVLLTIAVGWAGWQLRTLLARERLLDQITIDAAEAEGKQGYYWAKECRAEIATRQYKKRRGTPVGADTSV